VVVATDLANTARINGTEGTDHGTAPLRCSPAAAVKASRVLSLAGLRPHISTRGRDLAPTTDLRAVIKRAARSISRCRARAGRPVFPTARRVKAMKGLVG